MSNMNRKGIFLWVIITGLFIANCTVSLAQNNSCAIKGKVFTKDHTPVEGVVVFIKEHKLTATTN